MELRDNYPLSVLFDLDLEYRRDYEELFSDIDLRIWTFTILIFAILIAISAGRLTFINPLNPKFKSQFPQPGLMRKFRSKIFDPNLLICKKK
jgi:hypothetical protein